MEQYLLKTDPALQIITWNDRFRKGFQTAEVGKAAAEAINAAMNNSHDPMFSLGFTVGVPAGVWEDLVGQLKALVFLGLLPGQLLAKLYLDPTGFKQAAQQLADLPMKTLAGAEPLGKKTGEFLADRARELATASPYDQGYSIGKVVGYLVAEIALLFIGVEAVSAAAKALRATALGTRIAEFVQGSRVLEPLAEVLSLKKAETVVEDAAKAGKVVEESHVPTKPATEAPPSTKPATEAPPSTKTPTEAPPSTKTKDPAVTEPELTTGAKQEIKNATNTPGTKEYQQRIDDLAKDPAKSGAISPKSKREAAVGLAAEHDGLIPGPISRAPKGPKGEDLGEFVDAVGDRWDVKSSPDTPPSYHPNPAKARLKPQTDAQFTSMIEKDLAAGEKILIDPDGMSPARRAALEQLVANNPQWRGKVVWGR
ncbi:hypothetical protein [Nocardia colli]|uniref:hypothetical protein n=1 Tax=Nocardia colli TaxID=2545717 RepID=UPI00168CB921|nr:hypothetical protein [Nocardia colli]